MILSIVEVPVILILFFAAIVLIIKTLRNAAEARHTSNPWKISKVVGRVLAILLSPFLVLVVTLKVVEIATTWSPHFDEDAHFHNGLAPVRIHGKYGYIEKTGRIVIKPQYFMAGNFSEGVAWVSYGGYDADSKVGIVDVAGHLTPMPQIHTGSSGILPESFSGGYAAFPNYTEPPKGSSIQVGDDTWLDGYVDKSGAIVLKPFFITKCPVSDGVVGVAYAGSNEHALIDMTTRTKISLNYGLSGCYSEGLQGVVDPRGGSYKSGYVNEHGEIAIPLSASGSHGGEFSEGLAAAMIQDNCAYVDKTGAVAIPPFTCQYNHPFKDGVAVVQLKNGYMGYIDRAGNWIISAQFKEAGDFSEGLALVDRGGKQEFIDKTGRTVLTISMISSKAPSAETARTELDDAQTVASKANGLEIPDASSITGKVPGIVMDNPSLKPRFEKLLGSSIEDFKSRLEVGGTTERSGDWIVGAGNMAHFGGSDDAAYAINVQTGEICAVMRVNQEVKVFGVNAVAELPPPLAAWLSQ